MNHRNSQKRLEVDEGIFSITVNTKDRYPYFQEEVFCDLFIEELRLCKQMRKFRLYGFSLMHDHFHMLIHPDEGENISRVMHYLKRNTSRDINSIIEGEDNDPRLHNLKSQFLPLFEVLKNHKQSLNELKHKFHKKYPTQHPFPHFSWQSSFHDHLIRNERDLQNQLNYIWWNPEKHGLTTDAMKYPYSSFGFHRDLIDLF